MARTPSFPDAGSAQARSAWVPVAFDLKTEGHFLLYRLRVDGQNLEPSAGTCRRWFMRRVAVEAGSAPRTFCNDDSVWVEMGTGGSHTLDLLVGSEHTVVKRVVMRPGANIRWRIPIRTAPIEIALEVEPGHSYTVQGREEDLDLRAALLQDAPSGTRWDLKAYEPVYHSGVEVGRMAIRVLSHPGGGTLQELSVPLVSGRLPCEPPFCAGGAPGGQPEIVEPIGRESE